MKRILLCLLTLICFNRSEVRAQIPNLPVKGILNETLLTTRSFNNSSQVDTVVKQHEIANNYTLELVGKVNAATGRGLDIEARDAGAKGFRLSLDAAQLKWTSSLSAAQALTASSAGYEQKIRIAVKNDSAHIYQNGAFIQTQPLSSIKDIVGGVESEQLLNLKKGPTLIPNWAGTAPNNMGRPSDYGWGYSGAATTTLFNVANGGGGSRYMDLSASSGGNLHTYNGSTYVGRVLYIRWDGSAYQNAVYYYPVTLEANTTYDFSMLHAYISNATGSRTMTVGIGKTTTTSGRIASRVFTTSGTRDLKRENFVFKSQDAGTYYVTITGNWALFSIGELALNKIDLNPRFIFGKNYPSGAVNMDISSVTYEEGAYAPATIETGPQQIVTVTDKVISVLPTFNTNFVVPGKTDLHLTGDVTPLVNSSVDLNSEDAWLFFDNIRPSVVIANWLDQVKVNGVPANNNPNVRVAIYKNGTVVIPNGNQTSTSALEVFTMPSLSGDAKAFEIETYHNNLGDFNNKIRSFKLRRGYMATLATNPDGSGYSRVFIANDDDVIVNTMPQGLDATVSFIRVFKWDWVSKKGKAGWSPAKINSTWYYDWNIGGGGSHDYNYAIIRQNGGWPSWGDINNKKNVNHLLGFNEPDRPDQANMTVDACVAQWPEMMKSGLRIGSPAPASPHNSWITDFLSKCDQLNYRVDFVAIHCYWGGLTPQQWYSQLKSIYDRVKRPLWITEWNNGANWTAESWPTDQAAQFEKQLNDMKGILQVLDTTSFVERYAIYDWVENKRAMVLADTLTPAGKYYAANKSGFAYNPQRAFVHNWKLLAPSLSSTVNTDDHSKVTLVWKDVNGELGSKYILERKVNGVDADFVSVQEFTGYALTGNLSYVDDIFDKASYRVKAFDFTGTQSAYSASYDVVRDVNPVAPSSLTGEVLASSKIKLTWNAGTNARSYNLKRSLSPDGPFVTVLDHTSKLEYLDEELTPSTTYYYAVTSLNTAGESENSTVVEVRTKDLVAPAGVVNPHVASADAKAVLTWDFIYDAKYDISRAETESGTYETIATDIDAVRYEDFGRVNGNTYYYKIVAQNAAGRSPETQVLVAKPAFGRHLYISFNESTGTFAEDVWGGYHGTLGATATRDAGYFESAAKLDGTSTAYASLAGGPVSTLNDFTIATWVKLDALSNWMRIFDFGTGTSKYMFLTAQSSVSSGNSNVRYAIKNGGAEQQVNFAYAFPLNTWTHFAITQSGNTASLYINGELIASNTGMTIKPSDLGITNLNYIGKSQFADPILKGSVDEFKIYNYALSNVELADAMKAEQFITWSPIAEKQIGDPDFAAGATASSGLPVTYTSSNEAVATIENGVIHITGAGTSMVTAQQQGDATYTAAKPVAQTLTVNKQYFVDADGDGFGSKESKLFATEQTPAGYAANNMDCDDSKLLYADIDGDGLGAGTPVACGIDNNTDCDDTNPVPVSASIADVYALNPAAVDANTLYTGYGPSALVVSVTPQGGRAPYTYQWSTGQTSQAISVSAAGSYKVTLTDAKGCTVTTAPITIKIVNVTCGNNGDKVLICHKGKTICISAADVQDHLNHGCRLGTCTGEGLSSASLKGDIAEEELNAGKVKLYPNPVTDLLNIWVSKVEPRATVQLYNVHGAVVVSERLVNTNQSISLKGLASGVYYVQVKNGAQITFEKVMKQ